jgi:hypothetical protein
MIGKVTAKIAGTLREVLGRAIGDRDLEVDGRCGRTGQSPAEAKEAVDESIERLGGNSAGNP